ncbi:hypothetical protein QA601_13345 [Chitinispirillales bacterium ANBcel5]|uniref:hypothetical protein n=1 Tax=Cellulosispirillum alkaliphilum TaxID=3039283 RepID=UPI002A585CEE|nr:hypothetical protein [Chitinispirillales bacterium ANBcel5]
MDLQRYLFRRQYIIGPHYAKGLEGWKQLKIEDNLFLTAHPDLSVTTIGGDGCFLLLLGYILDPLNPQYNDTQILSEMFSDFDTFEDIFEKIDHLGGRYVLIAGKDKQIKAFNDCAGFRQLFFHTDLAGKMWCAGQPSLLAEQCGIAIDLKIRNQFFSLPLFTKNLEHWYPAGFTIYKKVYHLQPNHFLDMKTGSVKRYWPRRPINSFSLDTSIEYSCSILRGMMESAVNRFEVAVALTAGLDSRIIFAASRDVYERLFFFTHTNQRLSLNDPDITIPSQMLSYFGLKHNLVYHFPKVEREFANLMNRNVVTARSTKICNAYTMYNFFNEIGREMVVTNGVVGEMTRSFYFLPKSVKLNGYLLAMISGMGGCELVTSAFTDWLRSAKEVIKDHDNLLNLFYWEQRNGNWAAMSYSEYDIAFESLSPLNCRKLVEVSMGLKPILKNQPDYRFHKGLIRRMWPEVLNWDINPAPNRLRSTLRSLKRTKAHSLVKTIRLFPYSAKGMVLSKSK